MHRVQNPMVETDPVRWAESLQLPQVEHASVVRTLTNFPSQCRSRGMFATGVLQSVKRVCGEQAAMRIQLGAGYPKRVTSFALYPHANFYRVFYASARAMFPGRPLGLGMRSVAESFYPTFIESLAGKTMNAMLGRTAEAAIARFVDAYKIATPWNKHAVEFTEDRTAYWNCMVEPCDFYEHTFSGICTGMVQSVAGVAPNFEVTERTLARDHQRMRLRISW